MNVRSYKALYKFSESPPYMQIRQFSIPYEIAKLWRLNFINYVNLDVSKLGMTCKNTLHEFEFVEFKVQLRTLFIILIRLHVTTTTWLVTSDDVVVYNRTRFSSKCRFTRDMSKEVSSTPCFPNFPKSKMKATHAHHMIYSFNITVPISIKLLLLIKRW